MTSAEIKDFQIQKVDRPVRFESIEQWLGTEFKFYLRMMLVSVKAITIFMDKLQNNLINMCSLIVQLVLISQQILFLWVYAN
jgi:hypothetical protein